MPPKAKFTQNRILQAALNVVREKGLEGLSFRAVAGVLGSSTMPVCSVFGSREELEEAVARRAFALLYQYQITKRTGDPFLDMGLGYVLFARAENNLFHQITAQKNVGRFKRQNEAHMDALLKKLADYPPLAGLSRDQARNFFLQGWTYAHGLACLVSNGYYQDLDEEGIRGRLLYTGERYLAGFGVCGPDQNDH